MESKNGGKAEAPGTPREHSAVSEIETALDFLGSEEYQEFRQPDPHAGDKAKQQYVGKAHENSAKNSVFKPDPIQVTKKEDSAAKTIRYGEEPRGPQIEIAPKKVASESSSGTRGTTSRKIWLFCLGTAVLLFLAVLFTYGMGYWSLGR